MKVLSLKQPFAELILQGRKAIELRKWNTKINILHLKIGAAMDLF
jgi:predicted transcriptional regulator